MPKTYTSIILAGVLMIGCTEATAPPGTSNSSDATAPSPSHAEVTDSLATVPDQTTPEIPVEIASWDELQNWIAGKQGKVVVIDVWSTFCLTCMKEFPHFVELHEKYGDRVACASMNVDFYGGEGSNVEEVRPQVLKFLSASGATMQNFISSDPDASVLQQINTSAIPAALVYDQQGKLYKIFNNDRDEYGPAGFTYGNDITPLVEKLLQAGH